jgi:hypothetical protein
MSRDLRRAPDARSMSASQQDQASDDRRGYPTESESNRGSKQPGQLTPSTAPLAPDGQRRWPVQVSSTEDPEGRQWDVGYLPLAMLIAALLLPLLPSMECMLIGLSCLLLGSTVACCILYCDWTQGKRISPATWCAIGLTVLFPVVVLVR